MFILAFIAAWMGSTAFVVTWALLGVLFSKRSIIQSAALVVIALTFGTTAVLWYIGVWWMIELAAGIFAKPDP